MFTRNFFNSRLSSGRGGHGGNLVGAAAPGLFSRAAPRRPAFDGVSCVRACCASGRSAIRTIPASLAALVGGRAARPARFRSPITGVLFLDELPEFNGIM
jgi:hypothetical protein